MSMSGMYCTACGKFGQHQSGSCPTKANPMSEPSETPDTECDKCGEFYHLLEGCDPTPLCDSCAHLEVERLTTELTAREREVKELRRELNWQNNRNSGHPTKGGFEFYINEEWTGLAAAALDKDAGWHAAIRKHRIDPDDERVRIRRVAEDDAILKQIESLTKQLEEARDVELQLRSIISRTYQGIGALQPDGKFHASFRGSEVEEIMRATARQTQ